MNTRTPKTGVHRSLSVPYWNAIPVAKAILKPEMLYINVKLCNMFKVGRVMILCNVYQLRMFYASHKLDRTRCLAEIASSVAISIPLQMF